MAEALRAFEKIKILGLRALEWEELELTALLGFRDLGFEVAGFRAN